MRNPNQIGSIFMAWQMWFRAQPKSIQIAIGVPILALLSWVFIAEAMHQPHPGEPRKAFWFTLILLVASVVLTELLRPKPLLENAKPAGLGDFQFPTATEGRVVPLIWGKVRVKGPNVVWYGDLKQEAITERVKTGMFSKETIIKGFKYYVGVQMAVCRGPNAVLKRAFIGDVEVFSGTIASGSRFDINEPELFGGDEYGRGGVEATCDFYGGENNQTVNAYLDHADRQKITTAATQTAPRLSGTAYVVAREMTSAAPLDTNQGAYIGNDTGVQPWTFELERFPGIFSGQSAGQHKIGSDDCNPMNVIYEILTNKEWGFGFSAASIDVGLGSSFVKASTNMINESNGFSMVLDRTLPAKDLLNELMRQVDGVVFLDHRTGKWVVKLARGPADANFGYDINTVHQFTDATVKEVRDFTRGSWEDTTNSIQVKYTKRDDDYKESYALAQDMANAIIIAGGSFTQPTATTGIVNMPGVKISSLASNLAWRELRGHAYPLARASFIVNRENWDLTIGSVFAWTNAKLGFVKLPMRATKVDYGALESNEMVVTGVQDVFSFAAASMGTPPATEWTPPTVTLTAFPSDEQLAFEAPRGLVVRDPDFGGDDAVSKVFASARRQGGEVAFRITQRNASGAPAGSFANEGDVVSFVRIGALNADLDAGSAYPLATLTIKPGPDAQTILEGLFDDATSIQDMGVDLVQMIMVGNEFMLVQSAATSGANVNLQNVYRGVLDSAQENHLEDDPVYLVFAGAGIGESIIANTNNVQVELRPRSASTVFAGSVTQISFTMAKRALRPYPPSGAFYNGGSLWGTPNLEGDGSGLNGVGFDVDWRRRRYNPTDELSELLADQSVDASTEYRVRVFVAPSGANVMAFDSGWVSGSGPVTPTQVFIVNEAAAGTEIRTQIEARHDIGSEVDLVSRYNLIHDRNPTSSRTSQFYLGGDKAANVATSAYTALATGTYTVNIGGSYSTSVVEFRLNAGAWTTAITAGNTTGSIPGVTATDTIELRHTVNETPARNFVELVNPSAAAVAYGVFTNNT